MIRTDVAATPMHHYIGTQDREAPQPSHASGKTQALLSAIARYDESVAGTHF